MKARGAVLLLCAASAALRAEDPDWFDAFRDRAFLQGDASFVAREKSAPPDTPPLFQARWVVLRYAEFGESERRWWPHRNLLLVTMPSGARYVLESSLGFMDENHLDEDRPSWRVASERVAFEVWMSGSVEENPADVSTCDRMRERVRAPGGTLDFFVEDLGSRTVRVSLAEIAARTFDEDERRDLAALLKVSVESNSSVGTSFRGTSLSIYHLRDPLLAVNVALRDQLPPPDKRTVVFVPDSSAPTDLSSWRAFARLPLDLPPFPPLPPEAPVR